MQQKKLLFHSESSYLKTGYGKICQELCKRLHEAGHIVGELGNYGHIDYPLKRDISWMHYAMAPGDNWNQGVREQEAAEYNSNAHNQFGLWRINDVLLHFKPDIVISYLDHWMSAHILHNPMKHCFKLLWVPTVDAYPQNEQWIADFIASDAIHTYTDFAYETLKREGGDLINLKGVASPGVDNKIFIPINNRKHHKQTHGIPPNAKVVGTIMRNQRRKLYPDLFLGFKKFLEKCQNENKELGQNTFLYFHTSYPDLGWDIPRLLKETGLSHKVLFSYVCHSCGAAFPSFFADAVTVCAGCNKATARLPTTQMGISDESLSTIYNLFDVYVQYANSEGLGMPCIEAASCGVHPLYVDYSGMEDFKKLGGTPIKYKQLTRESETHCLRAVPDNDDFADKLFQVLSLPESILLRKGLEARKGAIKHYVWDDTSNKLLKTIEELDGNWAHPPKIHQPKLDEPQGLSDRDFVYWCIVNILGEPDKVNSYFATTLLKELNLGLSPNYGDIFINEDSVLGSRQRLAPFGRDDVKKRLLEICNKRNMWEARRVGLDKNYTTPSWLLKSISK